MLEAMGLAFLPYQVYAQRSEKIAKANSLQDKGISFEE